MSCYDVIHVQGRGEASSWQFITSQPVFICQTRAGCKLLKQETVPTCQDVDGF